MAYSCENMRDEVLESLKITVPEEAEESPLTQAGLALDEIERLQNFERRVRYAMGSLKGDLIGAKRFIERIAMVCGESRAAAIANQAIKTVS